MQPLSDGTPVGVASLRNLKSAIEKVIAVVRTGDDELANLLRAEDVQVVSSDEAWRGMGHSLANAIANAQDAEGWLVALGDMPRVQPGTIRRIASQLRKHQRIVVPVHEGNRGHPVGFPRRLRMQLEGLTGDAGARSLIQGNSDEVLRVEVADEGVLQDVDTLADLKALDVLRPS